MDFDRDADEHERFAESAHADAPGNAVASSSGTPYPEDEELDVQPIQGKPVIMLKVPDYVTKQWAQVKERGVPLGKIRVYDPVPGSGGKHEYEFTFNFPAPDPKMGISAGPALTFSSTMISGAERGKNRKYLMREKDRIYDFYGRSRQPGKPQIFAAVNLEHNLLPKSTPQDQALFKELVELEAKREAEQIKKTRILSSKEQEQIKRAQAVFRPGPRSNIAKPAKRDNLVRADKSVLIDTMLQSCFQEYQYWNLKGMAERLQQPTTFVREVLGEIAEYHSSGPYAGYYKLQERFSRRRAADTSASEQAPKELAPDDVKPTAEQLADLERRQREAEELARLDRGEFGEEEAEDDEEEMEEVDVA